MEKVEELSLIEKIGQLFLIGLEENKITNATKEMILKYKIGGFILYKKNYKNYHEMLKIINELKEINRNNRIPLLVDKLFPVSLSKKIIKKYLREKENYDGVIITDDIKMQAISFFYGVERATKRALTVGNDVIMIKAGYKKEKCIMHSILKNKKLLNIIDKKVERILRLKEKYNINDISTQGCNIEEINNLIQEINNKLNL